MNRRKHEHTRRGYCSDVMDFVGFMMHRWPEEVRCAKDDQPSDFLAVVLLQIPGWCCGGNAAADQHAQSGARPVHLARVFRCRRRNTGAVCCAGTATGRDACRGPSYRYEAQSIEGFVQQLAVQYVARGYWFYVSGIVPEGKDSRAVAEKLIAKYNIGFTRLEDESVAGGGRAYATAVWAFLVRFHTSRPTARIKPMALLWVTTPGCIL